MGPTDLAFFRKSIGKYIESSFVYGKLDSKQCDAIRAWLKSSDAERYARELFRDTMADIRPYQLRLQLKRLREMDGQEFNHIEVIFISDTERPRRSCFVGHRFSPAIERTLRWNLRQILEPYNVELDWSGRDFRSVQILEDIVKRIKASDFCIFDDREAAEKPNVYIEAGMCVALEKPFVLFEHTSAIRRREAGGLIPSDLGHALALRYQNYRQLFWEFYSRLPLFFEKNLGGPRQQRRAR